MTEVGIDLLENRIRRDVPNLPAGEVHTLADIVQRLVSAYRPDCIYLFGSKARGDWGPDSDFDLMVVVSDNASSDRQGSTLAYRALRGTGVAADVLVMSRSAFKSRLRVVASLPAEVVREGKLLHAA